MLKKRNAMKLEGNAVRNRLTNNDLSDKALGVKKTTASKIRTAKSPKTTTTVSKASSQQTFYEDVQQKVRDRAYQLFVERGYEHGHDSEDWLRAESEILSESNRN